MKKILFNWYYHRFDLTNYILDFADDVEIVFLFKYAISEEPDFIRQKNNVSVIYWGDYSTPYKLLDHVKPDAVVFADLESFNQIALNIAARNNGITTYVLQHGLRGAFEVEEAILLSESFNKAVSLSKTTPWSLRFLFSSLRRKNLNELFALIRFVFDRKTKELTVALYRNQFELRRADLYIEYSEDNKGYHKMRDAVPDNRFRLTGNPLFDPYLQKLDAPEVIPNTGFCLLIDCPFIEANLLSNQKMTLDEKNSYLKKLSKWAFVNNLKLKVKLHPISYNAENLYSDENVEYFREADLVSLIKDAAYVFFLHFSTLTPLILAYKPAIYFHIYLDEHLKLFKRINASIIEMSEFDENQKNITVLAKKIGKKDLIPFIHSFDGNASARIKRILLNHS